jgi:aspartate racemase
MRTIGLIGGMSWESTAVYYRLINTLVRERLGGLRSAEIVLRSIDFERVVSLQKAGDWTGAGALLGDVARDLVQAGADSVLICTNTMHLVADQVAAHSGARLINIIDETAASMRGAGCRRPLLLATAYTMEHGFYADRMAAQGVQVQVPDAAGRAAVHRVIFDELCRGIIHPESRALLMDVVADGRRAGADSVILGCTEICLLLQPDALGCPGFDSTTIHARAAVDDALRDEPAQDGAALARAA